MIMPNAVNQRRGSLASTMLQDGDQLLVESLLEDGFVLAEEAPKAWSRIAQVSKPETSTKYSLPMNSSAGTSLSHGSFRFARWATARNRPANDSPRHSNRGGRSDTHVGNPCDDNDSTKPATSPSRITLPTISISSIAGCRSSLLGTSPNSKKPSSSSTTPISCSVRDENDNVVSSMSPTLRRCFDLFNCAVNLRNLARSSLSNEGFSRIQKTSKVIDHNYYSHNICQSHSFRRMLDLGDSVPLAASKIATIAILPILSENEMTAVAPPSSPDVVLTTRRLTPSSSPISIVPPRESSSPSSSFIDWSQRVQAKAPQSLSSSPVRSPSMTPEAHHLQAIREERLLR